MATDLPSDQVWETEALDPVLDSVVDNVRTTSRQRTNSHTGSSRQRQHLQHPGSTPASASRTATLVSSRDVMPRLEDEAQEEVDGYLAPLLAPMKKRRQRINSLESWGSSVMPAALPFAAQRASGGYRDRGEDRRRASSRQTTEEGGAAPVAGIGLDNWLQSQTYLSPHPPATGSQSRGEARQSGSSFPSFAPSGRIRRRVDSEAGSAAGEGSLGGWSNGVMSSSGRRKLGSGTTRIPRPTLPLWEGGADLIEQEEPRPGGLADDARMVQSIPREDSVASNLSSVLQWRDSSAMPPSTTDIAFRSTHQAMRKPLRSHAEDREVLKAPSPNDLVLPSSASRQMLRTLDLRPSPVAQQARPRPEATPLRIFVRGMMKEGVSSAAILIIGLAMLLPIKWAIAAGGWSGEVRVGWEKLRHWQSVTTNFPADKWYTYDLDHHLLNQPPLAAYLSWCLGSLALRYPALSDAFAFPPSRSTALTSAHTYMVLNHLLYSHVVYICPLLWFVGKRLADRGRRTKTIVALTVLGQPALLLSDYGLGGWTSVSLGLLIISLALFHSSLPNVEVRPVADVTASSRHNQAINLSRKVSYMYVAAISFLIQGIAFDQRALTLVPAALALFLGRLAGLAGIEASRGVFFSSGIFLTSILTVFSLFGPWMSSTSLAPLRHIFDRLGAQSAPSFTGNDIHDKRSIGSFHFGTLLSNSLPFGGHTALGGLTMIACLYPCVILFRSARETVCIEMRLSERKEISESKAEAERPRGPSSVADSTSARGMPPAFPGNPAPRTSGSVAGRRQHTRSSSQAPSDAGSDLRSLAESIVRGESSALPSGRARPVERPVLYPLQHVFEEEKELLKVSASCPSPSAAVLPYAAAAISVAVYLFYPLCNSYEASLIWVLYPLLPLTLLTVAKGDEWGGGAGKVDWEWTILANNVATFTLWPLVRRDGLSIQYTCLILLWNFLIGYRPFAELSSSRSGTVAIFGAAVHGAILVVHLVSFGSLLFDTDPALVPALVNAVSTASLFVVYLWSVKRVAEVALGNGVEASLGWSRTRAVGGQQQRVKKREL